MTYIPEIEFKFFPKDKGKAIKNLDQFGVKKVDRTLMRAAACRKEDNPAFHDLDIIRVRDEWRWVYVTMKQWFVDGVELEHALEKDFSVSDFESAVNMFTHLGLFISVRWEKYRTTWVLDDCEIVLDENPWLEPYFEIEWPSEESIKSVCDRLGCEWETRREGGTRMLYVEKYWEHARTIRNITFTENPFIL